MSGGPRNHGVALNERFYELHPGATPPMRAVASLSYATGDRAKEGQTTENPLCLPSVPLIRPGWMDAAVASPGCVTGAVIR